MSSTHITIAEFEKLLPETRVQLVAGRLVHEPAPSYRHQRAVVRLIASLSAYSDRVGGEVLCAPIDVQLSERDVLQPDVIYISSDRSAIITDSRIIGAPDLVVEVFSKGTARLDYRIKKEIYERAGVREYWIVDLAESVVDMFVLEHGAYSTAHRVMGDAEIESSCLPGLALNASILFR